MHRVKTQCPIGFRQCFRDRLAVVVGGSSGIGFQVARDLSELGAKVVIAARNVQRLTNTAQTLRGAVPCQLDASNPSQCASFAKKLRRYTTQVDYLVIAPGRFHSSRLGKTGRKDWERSMSINLGASLWLVQALLQLLQNGVGKSIVVVSSILAHRGARGSHVYCASKGGLSAMVRSLALDLAEDNIRINAVSPGHVVTPMISELINTPKKRAGVEQLYPLKRLGRTSDVSALILFLLSPFASWITGADYIIDGGRSACS